MDLNSYHHCFGCGKDNPYGLRLKPTGSGGKSRVEFYVESKYCGYPGILHGGVTCILMDEAMFYAVASLGIETVTVNISVDYKNPAFEGTELVCEGWFQEQTGKDINVSARLYELASGRTIAEGRGRFLEYDFEELLLRN